MKTACNCGWTTDPKRATRLHDEDCPTMKTFRDERASVTGGILTLISENGALLAENERLRDAIDKVLDAFFTCDESQGNEYGMRPGITVKRAADALRGLRAALAGGRGEK